MADFQRSFGYAVGGSRWCGCIGFQGLFLRGAADADDLSVLSMWDTA